ncbi:MAG TPA: signal peptidase I [Flavobacterium sp.]|jgi:signal peptidase I
MSLEQWLIFFLIVQIVHFAGTWRIYEAAGRKRWEAAVPLYNAMVLMKIINRPTWWTLLLFIPIVNLIMFPVIWVETLRSFGKNSTTDTILGIVTLGLYIYYVNYTSDLNYVSDRSLRPLSKTGDTFASLLFAIVVATIVHGYIMQPFQIPSSSLEKSLLVGDFLFVSKFHYGARVPMTTIAAPMVHDTIPVIKTRSYAKWPQLPYFRLPGIQKVERNDIVVFNWPVDTVYKFFDRSGRHADKPADKRSNYVKRCVGIPGDSISIKDGILINNGKPLEFPDRAKPQYSYAVTFDGKTPVDLQALFFEMDIIDGGRFNESQDTLFIRALTQDGALKLKSMPGIVSVTRNIETATEPVFPQIGRGNRDNMGPIYVPQQGKTVALTPESLPYYTRIITEYENNTLQVTGNEIRVNGKVATTYTFKQNYYWMMGDNRHNSEDSRYWGYVPEDHIVGKPVFIWFSYDGLRKQIRWDRVFTTVSGEGERTSYFKYFLFALAAYFVIGHFASKRKQAKK